MTSLHLDRYLSKRDEEPLTEMKRRHFIMLSKGREDMKLFLESLGISPLPAEVVEIEKVFYLSSMDKSVFGLEGNYEEQLYDRAVSLVEALQNKDLSVPTKQEMVLSYLSFLDKESADASMADVVFSYLDSMKSFYMRLPETLQEEGRAHANTELSKWTSRLESCGMTLQQAQDRVFSSCLCVSKFVNRVEHNMKCNL